MFRQIMLPLDGSELAERALPCAERLATALGAVLHVVRVVEPPVKPSFASPHLYEELLTAEHEAAAAYLNGVRKRLAAANVPVRIEQPLGSAASTLLEYERDAGIDLVVMCSHGRSGIARFALGSVADRLLHQSAAPVLLVRAFGEPPILNRAMVPLDGSTRAEAALQLVEGLAPAVVHEVRLLRAIGADEEELGAERYLVAEARRLQQKQLVCHHQVAHGDPAQAIIEAAGSDALVVMATHGRSGLTRWALGSVADRVARGSVAGVLLVRTGSTPVRQPA